MEAAPSALINTYRTADEQWVTVTSGTPRSVQTIAEMVGESRDDYATGDQLRANRDRLDDLLREWIAQRTLSECLAAMDQFEVVASRIYSPADIVDDPTYQERGDIVRVEDGELGSVRMQGVVPRLVRHGGKVWRTGPSLGQDNELVYKQYLGLSDQEYERYQATKTI
jgi:formyl-CoA transferase